MNKYVVYLHHRKRQYNTLKLETMKTFPSKEKLIKILTSKGCNVISATEQVEANYDYVKRVYPESTPIFLANVIVIIY